ncbi:MAG: winged helix-turn-helix domain-containing protein [Terriglobia bacterium]
MDEDGSNLYLFGAFRLDPLKRILWRAAERVPLNAKAFDTLLVLVKNSGRTVGKDELITKIWAGATVEENNLTQCVSALRKTLGEKRGENRFIVTVPGRGYRFVMRVTEATVEEGATEANESPGASGSSNADFQVSESPQLPPVASAHDPAPLPASAAGATKIDNGIGLPLAPSLPDHNATHSANAQLSPAPGLLKRRSLVRLGSSGAMVALIVIIAALLALAFGLYSLKIPHHVARAMASGRQSRENITLAVMPFTNVSGDPKQDYLGSAITEEVITRLGRSDPRLLRVIARTAVIKYQHSEKKTFGTSGAS